MLSIKIPVYISYKEGTVLIAPYSLLPQSVPSPLKNDFFFLQLVADPQVYKKSLLMHYFFVNF